MKNQIRKSAIYFIGLAFILGVAPVQGETKKESPRASAVSSAKKTTPSRAANSNQDADWPPEFDVPIIAGAMISIESYDPKSETFEVIILEERGVGPNIAMPGDLADAVSTLDRKTIESRPDRIVGNSYKLDKELRLISEIGQKKRAELLNKKKKKK